MAQNSIPEAYDPLVSLAADAADGALQHGPEVGLSQNTAARIRADLAALVGDSAATPPIPGAQAVWNAAKAAKVAGTAAKNTAESNARSWCASAVDLLKNYLGREWNSRWEAAGFTGGSFAMPADPLPLLGQLRAYFIAHPVHENPPLGIGAAAADAQAGLVSDGRRISNNSNADHGAAKQSRDAARRTLYRRMSGLLAELKQLLGDDDSRWYAFGFERPADGEQPGPVAGLVLTPGGPGMIFADWDDARRADRYRVFKQIVGVDAAPVEFASAVSDSEFTLTGLPPGSQARIHIVPVNDAGDGPESEPAAAAVP